MTTHTYTQEQHDKMIELLLKIQIYLPANTSPEECKVIDAAIKDIYKILYSETTTRKIYNPVTGKYYNITERSSVYDGEVKGLWDYNKKKN